jgi:DNA-binding NarL/FixJ family response regulator
MAETEQPGKDLKILIADDHEIVRTGVNMFLQRRLGCVPCLEASDGRVAVKMAEQQQPHVAIVDVSLPGLNGLELIQQIKRVSAETEIVVLTGHTSPELIQPAFAAGAKAFLMKIETASFLADAVLSLAGHRFYITPAVHTALYGKDAGKSAPAEESGTEPISTREREVLQLLAEGKSNKEVATLLGISVKTAETHRAAIMRKLKLPSLSHLVRYAIRHQIISA